MAAWMRYIVSGHWKSGTDYCMQLLKEIGIPLWENMPPEKWSGKHEHTDVAACPDGHAVKIIWPWLYKYRWSNETIIVMHRPWEDRKKSMLHAGPGMWVKLAIAEVVIDRDWNRGTPTLHIDLKALTKGALSAWLETLTS